VDTCIVCAILVDGYLSTSHSFPIPELFDVLCVYFWNDYVLIGGRGGAIKILCIRLSTLFSLEVEHPNILKKFRKSIDDFFVWNTSLYAVDNHIHPKYLLRYEVQDDRLCFHSSLKIKGNAPEERIKAGVLWGDSLVLLSRSAHRAGTSIYLSFYPQLQFRNYLCWHHTIGMPSGLSHIHKIRVHNEHLVLVTNLGVALLQKDQTELDLHILYPEKGLVDVYPREDSPWEGIQSHLGNQKKMILLQ
jgi:hypothetical protein